MAGEVKIRITATDDATDEIKQVNRAFESLGDSAAEANRRIESSIGRLDFIQQVQTVKQLGDTVGRVFNGIHASIGGLINDYGDYVEQVDYVARMTGKNTEEMSRLIQVADDTRISVDILSNAMRMATSKGIDVSIDGLARLADQYNALPEGIQRSQFLLETFGRQGLEMGKLLEQGGDGIRSMAAAVGEGLIVTETAKNTFLEARLEIDAFNDSVTEVKNRIAVDLIGAFMRLPEPMKKAIMPLIAFGPQISGTISAVSDLALGFYSLSQLFKAGGILSTIPATLNAIKASAIGLGAAVAPVAALAAAIAGLIALVNSDFGQRGITALKQLLVMAYGGFTKDYQGMISLANKWNLIGKAGGGAVSGGTPYLVGEKGVELFIPKTDGVIVPNHQLGAVSSNQIVFNYSPTVSMATRSEAEMVIKPMIENVVRARYGR